MIDLRNYKDYIRELVAEENRKDENWSWSVKSIGKSLVRIRWGYLDYMEEESNCFLLSIDKKAGNCLYAARPDGELIECYLVAEGKPTPHLGAEQTIKSGLADAIGCNAALYSRRKKHFIFDSINTITAPSFR